MLHVSVIIPVYNAERYLEQAVRSALDQPETGEVLLIEDASPDGSLAICQRLAAEDERVRLLRHPGGANRGAAESRNVGLRAAQCELLAFLDADDYYLPGRFRCAVELLEADADVDGVYEGVGTEFTSDEMRTWWRERWRPELTTLEKRVDDPDRLFESLVSGGGFHTNGITVRRSLVDKVGLFVSRLRMCQDTAMWLKMAAIGRLVPGRLDEAVAMRRLHGENRIVRDQRLHERYKLKMAWMMLRWCRRQRLERHKMVALCEHLFVKHRWFTWPYRGPVRRRVGDAMCLAFALVYCPSAWRAPTFRVIRARLIPWRWVLRRIGLARATEASGSGVA